MCATPVVLIGEQSWSQSEIDFRPGMTPDDGPGLDRARWDVNHFYSWYEEGLSTTESMVEEFVTLVNRHFAPDTR